MDAHNYELTDAVAGFDEGAILDVTARFGDWHSYRLKLEPRTSNPRSATIVVSDVTGFTESEILDETARIGDWHEYDLAFDPAEPAAEEDATGQVKLTMDRFERVAEPVETDA